MWRVFVFLSVAQVGAYLQKKPDFLKSCHKKDPDFLKCTTNLGEGIFQIIRNGLPGVELIPVEPLYISEIKISQGGSGAVSLNASFIEVNIHGLSNSTVLENRIDPTTYGFKLKFKLPKLKLDGNYTMNGRILILPIKGRGDAHFEPENVDVTAELENQLIEKDGRKFMDVKKVTVDMRIGKMKVQMTNLYNGAKTLERSTNEYLNQNWKIVFEAISPVVNRAFADVLQTLLQGVFSNLPFDYFIEDA